MAGDGSYSFEIVGESVYQDALLAICGSKTERGHEHYCLATLKPEPRNPHDRNAVAVFILGKRVGYLSRDDAVAFKKHHKSSRKVDAVIVGGWSRSGGDEGYFGVRLDL